MTVHPRVCGERTCSMREGMSRDGSSPRVRGTGTHCVIRRDRRRFIPACAGNGAAGFPGRDHATVHPRVCGERFHSLAHRNPRGRFIPACAGNGRTAAGRLGMRSVHPRVCGERSPTAPVPSPIVGSSPRVRGTADLAAHDLLARRFIPACAGNGTSTRPAWTSRPVHPRVCGERSARTPLARRVPGSSPRVRGTGAAHVRLAVDRRFIPACAGNGTTGSTSRSPTTVHPRVCGERSPASVTTCFVIGSSPRVRGTVGGDLRRGSGVRFIPACAGNGIQPPGPCGRGTVHPRVCGERLPMRSRTSPSIGSSPRVRGTG